MPRKSSSSSSALSGRLTLVALLLGLLMPVFYLLDRNLKSFYVFELDHLHDLAKRSIQAHGNNTRAMVDFIVDELGERAATKRYVNHDEEWMFNNAGGAMGAMYIIHASLTEYVIIFGSATGTEGHSGRYMVDNYFHMLQGTELAFVPGKFEPEVYPPGSVHHLSRGTVKQYRLPEAGFALEYSRGWIPPMLFFGFADGFTSTLDFPTMWRTAIVTGREMLKNALKGKL
ncbi:C-8 sterol isomerase [Thozetella sp. PMI_491]|nr:C-8 sterol isomerase [Thozetella sp. PMI_491]